MKKVFGLYFPVSLSLFEDILPFAAVSVDAVLSHPQPCLRSAISLAFLGSVLRGLIFRNKI